MLLVPAYNRDYNSKKEFVKDLNENKDFKLIHFNGSCYTTKQELIDQGILQITIRYKNQTEQNFVSF